MTDIHEQFQAAIEASIGHPIYDDEGPQYDLDRFCDNLRYMGRDQRVLWLARRIIETQCDENEPAEFLAAVSSMISDDRQVTIITHGHGHIEISGDIPENCQLVMQPPRPEPEPTESWHLRGPR